MTALRDYAARVGQPGLDAPDAPRYDELVGPDGGLRSAWKGLAEVATGLTATDLTRVGSDISRLLSDDGVAYTRPGDRAARPWRLDPIPLVLDGEQWAGLQTGLAQRAELLNALLVDLYGPQVVLAERLLPAAAVFAHPGFLRVVARGSTVDTHPLVFSATDLGRDGEGTWTVLADRAQAPSGLGFAMENRRVISRVLPELYREARLHRVAPIFAALRSTLMAAVNAVGGETADARVVVLSPGPGSETAYDQAFVASQLGFPLVEGADLVVRDGVVWLRNGAPSGRPDKVDVILRRVDAPWSDPLELRGDSQLGVAGLLEAVRRGNVRVVNGLGAGVLENPALLPFLPAVAQRLLGEELRLPSVPTWWGGTPTGREALLDRLGTLAVRAIDDPTPLELPDVELRALVEAAPHRYVGQERLPLSRGPRVGQDGEVSSRPVRLRTFSLQYGASYRSLVGGLASVIADDGSVLSSKDVWVLKRAEDEPDQGLAEVLPLSTLRAPEVAVPRALEDMFWLGRYTDRAEAMLRLVLTVHALAEQRITGSSGATALAVMMSAVQRLAGAPYAAEDLETDLRSVLLDVRREGSVAHSMSGLRQAAQSVRDQLSPDVWRALAVTDRAAAHLIEVPYAHQTAEVAGRMLTSVLSMDGVIGNMMRDQSWHVIGVGRQLERGLQLTHLLRATTVDRRGLEVDRIVHDAVLDAWESAVTHRRRFRGHVRPSSVLDLLLLEPANPRSMRFVLDRLAEHLAGLSASTGSSRPERLVADLSAQVTATDVAALVAIGGVSRPHLAEYLDDVLGQLTRIGDAVHALHFSSGPAPRPLARLVAGP